MTIKEQVTATAKADACGMTTKKSNCKDKYSSEGKNVGRSDSGMTIKEQATATAKADPCGMTTKKATAKTSTTKKATAKTSRTKKATAKTSTQKSNCKDEYSSEGKDDVLNWAGVSLSGVCWCFF
ncbi:hypothetical protein [Tunturiibacter lichenicola]|uniref:hypothetical protein n=1 Tax=Tunturiibacter lichenicola TaxID=2051959 RepID=UPI003D9BE644